MGRTIVVGDVHGCREELERLLEACEIGAGDEVVLVGDLVAKGPDSQGVVQLCRERGFRAVLGNHDAHVLRIRAGTLKKTPKPTHVKVAEALKDPDWQWLEALPHWVELPAFGARVVHAGLVPGVRMEEQSRELMITLRSITPEGKPSKKLDEGVPWASLWRGPEHLYFGHDAMRGLQQHPFATGLDTGCVYGGLLTAAILPERRIVSVRASLTWSEPGT